ncbi:MAG TPA: aminoglycoside phosphotransferase family protein [Candidatus Eisenbacteria bacterium]|nr:aminoglycoside phosphotransferase family protein [Candidatus Eisenbacteria bacterium]
MDTRTTATRPAWHELPARVRVEIERRLGARVVRTATQPGGFSPGLAVRVVGEDGRRAFVKAISTRHAASLPFYRKEASVAARLPRSVPTPALRFCGEYDEWIVLAFDDVDGRMPALPWRRDEVEQILEAIHRLSEAGDPCPVPGVGPWGGDLDVWPGWRLVPGSPIVDRLAPAVRRRLDELVELEAAYPESAGGDVLVHADLRVDNILLTADGVRFVDWACAARGAAWIDVMAFCLNAAVHGLDDPDGVFRRHPLAAGAAPDALRSLLAAVAGRMVFLSNQPAIAGLPALRAFQALAATAAWRWLSAVSRWPAPPRMWRDEAAAAGAGRTGRA